MPQSDLVRRYLEAGAELGQMTRARAESIIRELVRAGDVQREQAQERIDELVEWGRRNREQLAQMIRREINSQLSSMGVATKADLAALERKLTRGQGAAKAPAKTAKAKAAKKATTKKTATKKTATKKTATKKASKKTAGGD